MAPTADTSTRYDSSAGELSSPPSGVISGAASPVRQLAGASANLKMSDNGEQPHQDLHVTAEGQASQQFQMFSTNGKGTKMGMFDGKWVPLTAAGVPRKKPGRKPGTTVKPKLAADGSEIPKVRRPRKSKDPEGSPGDGPAQRRRKIAPQPDSPESSPRGASIAPAYDGGNSSSVIVHGSNAGLQQQQPLPSGFSPHVPKRESGYPGSMQSILNADDSAPMPSPSKLNASSQPQATAKRSSGQHYDPIRGNYDPVREMMVTHNTYPSTSGSPRGPSHIPNRSPSIASLIEPQAAPVMASPSQSNQGYQGSRFAPSGVTSMPPSPSGPPKTKAATPEGPSNTKKSFAHTASGPPPPRPQPNEAHITTIANGPVRTSSDKQKGGNSTPRTESFEEIGEGENRSILDFGKARPGEESEVPSIRLYIPLRVGETNKYVNFMRLAEEKFGWDTLHPRLAANRDRKARIAAAAASLEKIESGRASGDEMSMDDSEDDGSNQENGVASGPDATAKPKKKRNFKEDQYDIDDDFVDDTELLWEAQAAASRDGFFVYSGPLVPEEKPASSEAPPKRGRGGRGSRGGARGGTTRGSTTGTRGGGPGSRGGIVRKPRGSKAKNAERERLEKLASEAAPPPPAFTVAEQGA